MTNDPVVPRTRLFYGHTSYAEITDGAGISFVADEPPTPFQKGWDIAVEMSDNSRQTLHAEPSKGPTHVGWTTPHGQYWIFPLVHLERGRWRVQFEEQHRFLQQKDGADKK